MVYENEYKGPVKPFFYYCYAATPLTVHQNENI